MGKVTITGSLIGTSTGTGVINGGSLGAVNITGSVLGGTGAGSGIIEAGGYITSVTIGGSLEAGAGSGTARIFSSGNGIGNTVITGDLIGNVNDAYSGRISTYASIGNITIGSMTYGHIKSDQAVGNLNIYGDMKGGYINAEHNKIGTVTISGSLIGTTAGNGRIYCPNAGIAAVKVSGSILGGSGNSSGQIYAGGFITSVDMGGNVVPGAGSGSGEILRAGNIGPVTLTAKESFAYSQTLVAFGGLASPYTYHLTTGSLPGWATLNSSTGVLSGTPGPSDLGSTNFTVTASNGGSNIAQVYNLVVYSPLTVLPASSTALAIGTVGNAYNQTISASGGTPNYSFAVTGGGLPGGLNLNHSNGSLSGTPTAAGSFSFIVTVTDSNSDTASQNYTVTVNPAIVVSPTSPTGLAIGTVGNPYSQSITASGGAGGTYTFTTTDPLDGLTLTPGGLLSGSPTTYGTFSIIVTATDSDGGTGSQQYTLTVNPAIIVSPTSSTGLAIGTLGNFYSQTISATGGAGGSYTFTEVGSLDGLSLNASSGTLTGTLTAVGSYTFTVTATDSDGGTGTQQYTLTVHPAIIVSPTSAIGLAIATVSNYYSQTITASGGAGSPFTFTTTGPLDGLGLSTGGLLTGSPTTYGTFTFTITATDGDAGTGSQQYKLTVNPPIIVSPTSPTELAIATVGNNYNQTITASGGAGSPYTFTTADPLDGLSLSSDGTLSGSPTTFGTFTFTVTATDGNQDHRRSAIHADR